MKNINQLNTFGLVIATEWDEFKNLDFDLVKTKVILMEETVLMIKCNKNNIQYVGIGRMICKFHRE